MKKSILDLGTVLSLKQQTKINGGTNDLNSLDHEDKCGEGGRISGNNHCIQD